MPTQSQQLLGKGIYSLTEAYRITGVPTRRIVRWTRGYDFLSRGEKRHSPPIIAAASRPIDNQPVLDFLDLIEIRFLNAFRNYGVSWKAIRISAQRAKELLQKTHPFSTRIFKTDGRTILADFVAETGDKLLLDLVKNQYAFAKVISRYLYGGLQFNKYFEPSRWYPLGQRRTIVIDPQRSFGLPIARKSGVPTRILMQSYNTMKSADIVASWYETDIKSVQDAIEYEQSLPN